MFSRILVANDGSAQGYLALETAITVSKKFKTELHMIVVEEFPMFGDIEATVILAEDLHEHTVSVIKKSTALAKSKRKSLETHLVQGFPVPSISEFIETYHFDLLIIGFMERSALYRWFIGSTTDGLVGNVPCSVLVVKSRDFQSVVESDESTSDDPTSP